MRGKTALLTAVGSLLVGCATGDGPGATSVKPDYWGHRPGPRGFTTVVLDAGHGGKDIAQGYETFESQRLRKIAFVWQ